jgi:hypothetical protein
MRIRIRTIVWPVTVLGVAAGCATSATPQAITHPVATQLQTLQVASAGHTGCMPVDNAISNDGVVTNGQIWNATCNGKLYLCSAVTFGGSSASVSCAPAAR